MEHFDDAILQAIPDPALIAEKGRLICFNPAAGSLFANLACGAPVPDPLPTRPGAGGFLLLDGQGWHLTSTTFGTGLLFLLHPVRSAGISADQLDGVVRRLREQMSQLLLNIQLLTHSDGPVPETQLSSMNRTLCQMLRLVNHIDLLRDLDAGRPAFCPVTLDLAGLCRQVTQASDSLLEQAEVTLNFDCPSPSMLVSGDSELLQTLILELLSNSAQAAGRGGSLTLSLSHREGRALLTLSGTCTRPDNRSLSHLLIGLADQTRIPQPGEGAGLGLMLAQRIVHLHQGAIFMERREDSSVSVTVALPLAKPGVPLSVRTPSREYAGGFSPELLAFSDLLPPEAFSSADLE